VGELSSQYTAGGAVCKGFSQKKVLCFRDASAAGQALSGRVEPGDIILLKASRGMCLEETLNEL
jgi:UDP-N-acetylmuramyl pentapeptide synthase